MQDTVLRVLVVAVGLLICPKYDPQVQEPNDVTSENQQKQEERLLAGGENVEHEITSVNEEITHTDNRGLLDDTQNIAEENQADPVIIKREENLTTLKSFEIDHEQEKNSQLDPERKEGEDFQTDGSFRDMRKLEEAEIEPVEEDAFSLKEQESPLSHPHTQTTENETSEVGITDWERDYLWYLWNMLSIISMIRFFWKFLRRNSQIEHEETCAFPVTEVPLLDSDTLQRFHLKYVKVSDDKKWQEEFLEGFANDLLDAMKTVCDKNRGMLIEDFQMIDASNIIVPFTPSDPHSFQCLLWNNQASDQLPDMQIFGKIKLVENEMIKDGCPCQSPGVDEDMVCLLHCETEKVKTKVSDVCGGPLCVKSSPFLSKSQVTRWFQSTIKQAWAQISHKYEFELNIRYIDAPGALVVRFRSGKKINFSLNPVVKFNNDAHFFITPYSTANLDSFWMLSLTKYENRLLKSLSKHLPENSCHSQALEIACFLHRRQTALSGSSALKDFHFKNALMHLLLTKESSQWEPNHVAYRLHDLLAFTGRSLEKKSLHHVLIGNPLIQRVIELPAEFTKAKTVNLFHPLVVQNCIYRHAVVHFQEMLKNAHMLIHDYIDKCTDNAKCTV